MNKDKKAYFLTVSYNEICDVQKREEMGMKAH